MTVYGDILPADPDAGGCDIRFIPVLPYPLRWRAGGSEFSRASMGWAFPVNGLRRVEFGIFML
jgi:hypothetical protein